MVETGNRADFETCFDVEDVNECFLRDSLRFGDGCAFASEDISERKHRERNAGFLAEIQDDLAGLSNEEQILETVGTKLARFLEVGASMLIDVNDELDEIKPPHYLWRSDEIPRLTDPFAFHSLQRWNVQTCCAREKRWWFVILKSTCALMP